MSLLRPSMRDEENKLITIEVPTATRQRLIDEFGVKGTRIFPPVMDNRAVIPVYVVNKPEERKIYASLLEEPGVDSWQYSKTIINTEEDTDKPSLYRLHSLFCRVVADAAARATMAAANRNVDFWLNLQGVNIAHGRAVITASAGQGFEWNQGTHVEQNLTDTNTTNYTINSRINFVCPYPIIIVPVANSVNHLIATFQTQDGNNFPSGAAGTVNLTWEWIVEKVGLANAFETNVAG